jgi:hypothetical protein
LVVVAREPAGTVVTVVLAVIAVVKKYNPAVAFAITAPVVAVEVNVPLTVALVEVEPVIVAPVIVVPATSSGSEYATPTGLVLGIIFPFKIPAEAGD